MNVCGLSKNWPAASWNWRGKNYRKITAGEGGATMPPRTIEQASQLWLDSLKSQYLAESTLRKYRYFLRQLKSWCAGEHLELTDLTTLHLQRFMSSLTISAHTASKRVQFYKSFGRFCEDNGILPESPFKKLRPPRFPVPDRKPYTKEEFEAIIAACDQIDYHKEVMVHCPPLLLHYERLRALAALLILRHHALRISDVLALRRDAITYENGAWVLRVKAKKNGRGIEHRIPRVVIDALNNLPAPIGVNGHGNQYFFWSGCGRFQNVMDNMQASLRHVYRLSGVKDACNHRFRHTRASEILALGESMQLAADFLGITYQIANKHYVKWLPGRQERINALMEKLELLDSQS